MATLRAGALLARRYRLIEPIGAGGMSIIWRARDELLDRMVAIKVLAAELAADARFRALVREEARAAAQLVHPNVTAVHDYGELVGDDNSITAFVVMELLCGEELEARLTAGPLPWKQAIEVGAQVAEALTAAHHLGIVHRDVTPANIMLTANGAKVLDFGIATHIGAPDEDEDGDTFGTPAYVAPERLDGVPAQPATDTYSLGVLLFEMLSGRVPFPAETWDDLIQARQNRHMPPLVIPGLPGQVVDVCHRCLSRDPGQRPTAREVGATLRELLIPIAAPVHQPRPVFALVGRQLVEAMPRPIIEVVPRQAIPTMPVALAGAVNGTATLVGGIPDLLTGSVGYGALSELGGWPPDRPSTELGIVTGSGPPMKVGIGAIPGTDHDPTTLPDEDPARQDHPTDPDHGTGFNRPAWSPVRAGLAATGSIAALAAALLIGLSLGAREAPPVSPQTAPAMPLLPEPTATVSAPRGADSNAPATPGGRRAPLSTSPAPTIEEALTSLVMVIDDGVAVGDIRRDAGIDLQQLVRMLSQGVADGKANIDGSVALLRQKVYTRANEGAISPDYAVRLGSALDRLADAH